VTSCIVDSAAIYIMVVKFINTTWPTPPQLSLHRRAALSSNSNGTRSYIAERTQSAVYIVRCLWLALIFGGNITGGSKRKRGKSLLFLFNKTYDLRYSFREIKSILHTAPYSPAQNFYVIMIPSFYFAETCHAASSFQSVHYPIRDRG
jgi:hypothetical protein